MQWPSGRLFWKAVVAFWVALILVFLLGHWSLQLFGAAPPAGPEWLPLVPILSGTAVALLFGFGLAWYVARPLQLLSHGLRDAASARFDRRVAPLLGSRRDELADLARDFDRMAAQLQQALAQQQRLFHDISHELRSPLARMQAAIGLSEQDPDEAPAMLARIGREAQRLDALIEALLTLHKLENGAVESQRSRIDVLELLAAIAEDANFEAKPRGCSVVLRAEGSFVAEMDGELIYRAFENVARNAIKYAAADTVVEIDARVFDKPNGSRPGPWLQVTVHDRGPGVAAKDCEIIFEPFHRLEAPRGTETPGTGLGLAMARHAVVMHGGTIVAMPREGGGLRVSIALPAN